VGTDVDLRAGDPASLRSWLNRPEHRGVPVVVLHCWPYLREASWLAGLYADVHLDLSMAMQWVGSSRGPEMVLEVLGVAPVSKLLFGTDGFRVPELFYLGARWWRESLAKALGELVDRGVVGEPTAQRYAELVMRGNAHRVYGA
jgi:predicted TIM-barrel fold metal-dependent hydrolase